MDTGAIVTLALLVVMLVFSWLKLEKPYRTKEPDETPTDLSPACTGVSFPDVEYVRKDAWQIANEGLALVPGSEAYNRSKQEQEYLEALEAIHRSKVAS